MTSAVFFILMPRVLILNVIMTSLVMLNVVTLSLLAIVYTGNTNLRGRLSAVDLLLKVACVVTKV
jgi:hypothetical protein